MRNRDINPDPRSARDFSRTLRRHPTAAEYLLWQHLRGRQVDGLRFRRQEPVGRFIVDFLCPARWLIVELDGWSHEDAEASDARRQQDLERLGYRVLRFSNADVLTDVEAVVTVITEACSEA